MKKGILIIGGNGLLGRSLFQYYQSLGTPVFHTTRHELDLIRPNIRALGFDLGRVSHAIIAAGNTKLIECALNPTSTFLCNVLGTIELAKQLSAEGVKPIIFSSDYVFDGKKGAFYTEEDSLSPLNEYGKQKAEIEMRIPYVCSGFYLIIRLAKVYSLDWKRKCWVAEMASMLKQGQTVNAAEDQVFCPIFVDDVVEAVHHLQMMDATGVYNLGGEEMLNRYQIAQLVGMRLGSSPSLVRPILLKELQEPFVRPTITCLSSAKLIRSTNMQMKSMKKLMLEKEIHELCGKV